MLAAAGHLLAATVTEFTEERFEWGRWPHGWSAVLTVGVVAAACYAVIWLYRNERGNASGRWRGALAGLRLIVLGVLLVIWLEPTLVRYLHRRVDAYTLVLVDRSASMQIEDEPLRGTASEGGPERVISRSEWSRRFLMAENWAALRRLAERNAVKFVAFGDSAEALATIPQGGRESETPEDAEADPLARVAWPEPTAPATDIGQAVRWAIESLAGAPVAGIVLISDGVITRGEDVESLSAFLRQRGIGVYAVGVGDPTPQKNARIVELTAPRNVFVDDPFEIVARAEAEGLEGQVLVAELYERSEREASEGPGRLVATQRASISADGEVPLLRFQRRVPQPASLTYVLRLVPQPGEWVTQDNEATTVVRVQDNRLRVLIVAGAPGWEYRLLTRLLERDRTIDVSCWLQSAERRAVRDGNTVIDHLPRRPEEIYEYDVIVLLDPDPREFDAGLCETLARWVTEHGGGLFFQASRKYSPAFLRSAASAALREVLPVEVDPAYADLVFNSLGAYQQTAWPVLVPERALDHPLVQQADDAATNAAVWARLGEVYWHYPLVRAKPLAVVLMEHANPQMRSADGPHVLYAAQYAGAGRTAFLAFDGTWRWRRFGEGYHARFWISAVRYLAAGRLLGGESRGVIRFDRDPCELGGSVRVSARLLDANYQPMRAPRVQAVWRTPDGESEPFVLHAVVDRPGWYEATYVPRALGLHEIRVALSGGPQKPPVELRGRLSVTPPNIELARARMDREALEELAGATPGGRYFSTAEAPALLEAIPARQEELVIPSAPVPLWDRGWVLALLVAALGCEWAVRKLLKML